ncbi:hypothetical protein XELAEV_18017844mg [Xenopus laevis]|uniref:Uncharacterized protein n=1 Tax=Xenopus laevis TaxID=8355 RepID=A0A974DED2_XENLA|nr:hypothetical protein XELAEV_18017844mg [Xenopus laevis]
MKPFLVKQILRGLARVGQAFDNRKPITLLMLDKLVHKLPEVCFSHYEIKLFSLLLVFSFFAALRVSESISSNKKKTGGLDVSDVVLVQDKLRIILKKSKTDPMGKGTLIWLGSFWVESLCPMATFLKFTALQTNIPGPLFVHADGSFLSTFHSDKSLKRHLVRIGAATLAALFGFSEQSLMKLGQPLMMWIIAHSFVFRAKKQAKDALMINLATRCTAIGALQEKKLNLCIAKFAKSVNILVHRHFELELGGEGLYWYDRVHLSDIGNAIFNMGIQDAIEKGISVGLAKTNLRF